MCDESEKKSNLMVHPTSEVAQVLETEIVRDAYDQSGGRELIQQVFGLGEDFVKILRYLPQMVLFTGAKVKRLSSYIDSRVPKEHRQLPPAKYSLPAFQNLAVLEEDEALYSMFAELLAMAHNKTHVGLLHPRFAKSLEMLSSDDALVLDRLNKDLGDVLSASITRHIVWGGELDRVKGEARESISPPKKLEQTLFNPLEDAVENLISLGLAEWGIRQGSSHQVDEDVTYEEFQGLVLTSFGFRLLESCMPPEGLVERIS